MQEIVGGDLEYIELSDYKRANLVAVRRKDGRENGESYNLKLAGHEFYGTLVICEIVDGKLTELEGSNIVLLKYGSYLKA